mgnify:FL=1
MLERLAGMPVLREERNTMKKLSIAMLSMVLAGSMLLTACGGGNTQATEDTGSDTQQSETAENTEGGVLRMATNATFPPYEYYEGDEVVGIDPEIAAAIAEKLGMTLEINDMDFDPAIAAAQTGQADIVMEGLTVTDDRKEKINFTDSYATGVQVVIVPEDSDIQSVEDLEGKLIGVQQGTTGDLYCSDTPENGGFGEENVQKFTSGPVAVEALKNGQIDCVVIDNEPAKSYVSQNEGLKILDTEYVTEEYAIGISKDNPELLEQINAALQELKDDGTIQSIIDKYIPPEG